MGLFGRKEKSNTEKRYYDYSLLFVVLFICCLGLIMVYSSSSYTAQLKFGDSMYYVKRQAGFMIAGLVAMLVVSKIDYRVWARLPVPVYILSLVLMGLVNFTSLGVELNGKKRWLDIFGISVQPAEIVKVAVILFLACAIAKLKNKKGSLEYIRVQLVLFVIAAIPAVLVLKNNLSSGIIIFGMIFIMLFVASEKKMRFAVIAGLVVVLAVGAVVFRDQLRDIGILPQYQYNRIDAWLNPSGNASGSSYQTLQSLYAIGSGGLFGRGLGSSIQKLGFVPEAQNDMIFSIICEELGLFGALCVIVLFIFLIWRLMLIADNAPNVFGGMLVVGIMTQIAIQVILNIAVVTNAIPNTGVSLPFISYGGTSVMILLGEMGIALGVSNQIFLETPSPYKNKRSLREGSDS